MGAVGLLSVCRTVEKSLVQRVERQKGEEGDVHFKLLSLFSFTTNLVQQEWPQKTCTVFCFN